MCERLSARAHLFRSLYTGYCLCRVSIFLPFQNENECAVVGVAASLLYPCCEISDISISTVHLLNSTLCVCVGGRCCHIYIYIFIHLYALCTNIATRLYLIVATIFFLFARAACFCIFVFGILSFARLFCQRSASSSATFHHITMLLHFFTRKMSHWIQATFYLLSVPCLAMICIQLFRFRLWKKRKIWL